MPLRLGEKLNQISHIKNLEIIKLKAFNQLT